MGPADAYFKYIYIYIYIYIYQVKLKPKIWNYFYQSHLLIKVYYKSKQSYKLQLCFLLITTKGCYKLRQLKKLQITNRAYYTPRVVWYNFMMVWVDNEEVHINWDVSPVSFPDIVFSHRGKFNRGNDHWLIPLFPLDF